MKTVLVVDAMNAFYRLAYRLPVLTAKGQPVQVFYGFMRLLRSAVFSVEPDRVAVCWDNGAPTWRRAILKGYKQREAVDNEFRSSVLKQAAMTKQVLPLLGVKSMEQENTEADDLIAALCSCPKNEYLILSRDQDMLQLVSSTVSVLNPGGGTTEDLERTYTQENFRKLTSGLTPKQFLEMRILCGDSSDKIPGVAYGFGETTARQLLQRYGSIKALLSESIQVKLRQGRHGTRAARLAENSVPRLIERNQALIDLRVPLQRDSGLQQYVAKTLAKREQPDILRLAGIFREKGFASLLKDFSGWVLPFKGLR